MNVGTDEKVSQNQNLAKELSIMLKYAGGLNKCGRLMKNMISTNSGLINKS